MAVLRLPAGQQQRQAAPLWLRRWQQRQMRCPQMLRWTCRAWQQTWRPLQRLWRPRRDPRTAVAATMGSSRHRNRHRRQPHAPTRHLQAMLAMLRQRWPLLLAQQQTSQPRLRRHSLARLQVARGGAEAVAGPAAAAGSGLQQRQRAAPKRRRPGSRRRQQLAGRAASAAARAPAALRLPHGASQRLLPPLPLWRLQMRPHPQQLRRREPVGGQAAPAAARQAAARQAPADGGASPLACCPGTVPTALLRTR